MYTIIPQPRYLIFIIAHILLSTACNNSQSKSKIDALTKDGQKIIDSVIRESNKRYKPYHYADSLVNTDRSFRALESIDSLVKLYPKDHFIYISKGNWYYNNGQYKNALNEYNNAAVVAQHEPPIILEKKANTYIKLDNLTEAIDCYKKAAELNADYNYNLAVTYELDNKNDSAIKYFSYYSAYYPENEIIKKHIDSLMYKKSE